MAMTGKEKAAPGPPAAAEEVAGIIQEVADPAVLLPTLMVGSAAEGIWVGRRNGWLGKNDGAKDVGVRAEPPTGGMKEGRNVGTKGGPGCF